MAVLIVLCVLGIVLISGKKNKEDKTEIVTKSTLEKIINVSELSTYEAVYNGVAKVMNDKKTEKIDYHVYYEARVKAGIDFENVEKIAGYISPVPGGVGPLTIAMLLSNTLESYKNKL